MPESLANPVVEPYSGVKLFEDDGTATLVMQIWMEAVTNQANSGPPLVGFGSPEGVETANQGRWYVDNAAPLDEGIYFKRFGGGNTGWEKRS